MSTLTPDAVLVVAEAIVGASVAVVEDTAVIATAVSAASSVTVPPAAVTGVASKYTSIPTSSPCSAPPASEMVVVFATFCTNERSTAILYGGHVSLRSPLITTSDSASSDTGGAKTTSSRCHRTRAPMLLASASAIETDW